MKLDPILNRIKQFGKFNHQLHISKKNQSELYLHIVEHKLFTHQLKWTESEINEFEPRLISAKKTGSLNACLNFEILDRILSGTNHI